MIKRMPQRQKAISSSLDIAMHSNHCYLASLFTKTIILLFQNERNRTRYDSR